MYEERPSPWHPHAVLRPGAALLVLLAGAMLLSRYAAPLCEWVGILSPGCLFHKLTGIKCPGCGGTRALQALLNGEALAALRYNFFWLPTAFILAQEAVRRLCCTDGFRATRYFRYIYLPSLKLYAAAVVLWFFARNIFDW